MRGFKKLPEYNLLHSLFSYNEKSGVLTRKISRSNNVKIGSAVGAKHSEGYLYTNISYEIYFVHRIIWKMVNGKDPEFIDHVNGIRDDNRIENLRNVSRLENNRNVKTSGKTKSGVMGVYKNGSGWAASIKVNYKKIHLGTFKDKEEAKTARKAAEKNMVFMMNTENYKLKDY